MRPRLIAAALTVAAVGSWLFVAAPAQRERDRARAEYASARQQREQLRSRLAELERRAEALRAPGAGSSVARELRLSLLRATEELDLADVQVAVSVSDRSALAARARLSATGRLPDVLRVAGRLAEPESGVRLRQLTLADVPGGNGRAVQLELEADAGTRALP